MGGESEFTPELIASGAAAYGKAAAELLLEREPELEERFGPAAFRTWSLHLAQRSKELAAAILVSEADLFVADVDWSRKSFEIREVPVDALRASLECLRDALDRELPEGAAALPRGYLGAALARLSEPGDAAQPALGAATPSNRLALAYLEAALAGEPRRAIDLLLSAVEDGLGLPDAFACLQDAQTHVGELWHARQVSIAQEHVVTSTTEAVMALLARRAPTPRLEGGTVVVAPVSGNAHEIGATALAHQLAIAGWNAIHLGSELPAEELAQALGTFDARLLALSVTLSTQLPDAVKTIRVARSARPGVKVLTGGRVFATAPGLWRKIGADASATEASGALEATERLLGS